MPEVNLKLEARMAELGFKQAELARQVNIEIELLTGRPGNVTDADVRRWRRGATKWPQERIRRSLEQVLSATAEDLGFTARKKSSAVAASGSTNRGQLGVNDVRRLHQDYVAILRHDDAGRGPRQVESLATELASRIQSSLVLATASTRVRDMLHQLAAEVLSTAAFASIDGRAPQRARAHVDKALTFAGLSRNSEVMYHVWNHLFLTSSQSENHAEAVAGAEVMKRSSISRRDPLYASLGHIRNANGLARTHRPSEAMRALGDAERAFERATDQQRPEWIRFYDRSEFDALSAFTWTALKDHRKAEYHLHRTLSSLPVEMVRNRALYTAHLSAAQVNQGELELACATSRQACALLPLPGGSQRTARTLAMTRKRLIASGSMAPEVTDWIEESAQWI